LERRARGHFFINDSWHTHQDAPKLFLFDFGRSLLKLMLPRFGGVWGLHAHFPAVLAEDAKGQRSEAGF